MGLAIFRPIQTQSLTWTSNEMDFAADLHPSHPAFWAAAVLQGLPPLEPRARMALLESLEHQLFPGPLTYGPLTPSTQTRWPVKNGAAKTWLGDRHCQWCPSNTIGRESLQSTNNPSLMRTAYCLAAWLRNWVRWAIFEITKPVWSVYCMNPGSSGGGDSDRKISHFRVDLAVKHVEDFLQFGFSPRAVIRSAKRGTGSKSSSFLREAHSRVGTELASEGSRIRSISRRYMLNAVRLGILKICAGAVWKKTTPLRFIKMLQVFAVIV